jgi:hypothetical protein
MKKLIKMVLPMLLGCSLCLSSGFVNANAQSTQSTFNSESAQSTVQQYFNSINNKDWNTYVSLQLNQYQNDLKDYFSNDNNASGDGLLGVESVKIKEIKSLPDAALKNIVNISDYENSYGNIYSFLVGATYKVKHESKYYLNGTTFSLIIVGQEDGISKILLDMDAPLEILEPNGYGFNDSDEKAALKVIDARYKGIYDNLNGVQLGTNIKNGIQYQAIMSDAVSDTTPPGYPSEPSTISIYHLRSSSDPYYHTITTSSFDVNYVEDVLGNEWLNSWNTNALQAGAEAIKEYGWYSILHPKAPAKTYGADVVDSTADQVYILNSHTSYSNCTAAVIDQQNWSIANSSEAIFNAQYLAGTSGQIGTANSGVVSQNGTEVLATEGNLPDQILNYYYGESSVSSNGITSFECN